MQLENAFLVAEMQYSWLDDNQLLDDIFQKAWMIIIIQGIIIHRKWFGSRFSSEITRASPMNFGVITRLVVLRTLAVLAIAHTPYELMK